MVIGSVRFVVLDLTTDIQGPSRINSINFGYVLFLNLSLCVLPAGCGLEFLLVLCGLELSWSCPRHCICYTAPSTVSCQAHNLPSIPEGIPPDSERIFLQNNKIHRLLRGHFSSDLVTLWIYSNNITYIEPSTFHGFTLLEELDLGDNRHLRSLAEDTFHGLSRLNALHLYRCGLSSLPNNIFQGLRNLQYLYLQVHYTVSFWFICHQDSIRAATLPKNKFEPTLTLF